MRSKDKILKKIPQLEKDLSASIPLVLSTLTMVSEIPSPSFKEEGRRDFVLDRFREMSLENCSSDEVHNALGMIPGTHGEKTILLVSHMDSYLPESVDHTVQVESDRITGAGVSENALGVAATTALPEILESLGIQLKSNLILMGSTRSLGKADLEGIRFFLDNSKVNIDAGICLEAIQLGRLSYSSIGMLRGEIRFKAHEEYDWTRFGSSGIIIEMNEMINSILKIPIPSKPKTIISFRAIKGSSALTNILNQASLRFEIRSESDEMVESLIGKIRSLAEEMSAQSETKVDLEVLSQRHPGGILFSHPFNDAARKILKELGVKPIMSPSTSELSAFIAKGIPALTLGLTRGDQEAGEQEVLEISPLSKGLTQLIGVLLSIDEELHG